jgi:hypothetical protein
VSGLEPQTRPDRAETQKALRRVAISSAFLLVALVAALVTRSAVVFLVLLSIGLVVGLALRFLDRRR